MKRITKILPVFGIILLIFILNTVGLNKIIENFKTIDPFYFLIAILLVIPATIIKAIKWFQFIKPFKVDFSLKDRTVAMFIGFFIGLITPAKLGEFLKAFYLKKGKKLPLGTALSTVVFDRVLDVGILFFLAILGILTLNYLYAISSSVLSIVLLFFLGFIIAIVIAIQERITKRLLMPIYNLFIPDAYKDYLRTAFTDFYTGVNKLRKEKLRIFNASALTIIVWLVHFIQFYLIALALNINVSVWFIIMIMPAAVLIEILPISISGLGTREATLIILLSFAGISKDLATSFSLLVLFFNYLIGLPGLVLWIKNPLPIFK